MFGKLDEINKEIIYNLYFVRTPFQLINSYEAINYFKTKNNILIIIDNGTENNRNQLTNLIYKEKWSLVIRFGDENKSNFLNYVKLIKKIKNIDLDYFFIGSGFNKMQQILVANIKSNKTCFIDAGTSTLSTYENILKNNYSKISSLKKLRFKFFGLKTDITKQIDFFTMFDLEETNKFKVFINKYEFMKNKFNSSIESKGKDIYIIGQRFVAGEILEEEKYVYFLNLIVDKYSNCKINYLMHRTEKKDYLLNNGFDKKLNIISSSVPGELFFLTLNNKPYKIIGTVSTLMVSLKYIFKDIESISYRFKDEDFKKNKNLYKLEYNNMKNNNIKIVEL